ncbi:TetR/AcrR family transcriptional regulator [Kutzneria chonburiensis]|uniref:TetR/AcrR family transcriptional regulator n=1 Tax=Kutzneria chonburiensis TaxID=1483604 RepID=UPI00235E3AAC|nr:TetR/AcrR family transcriptional regulator [Kutzneria chonburiensis]
MGQEGSLARRHDDAPGLPRGRSSLPADEVRAAQRQRLLTATVAAVAAVGFSAITVADIVRGARVSRAAFYAHFSDKEDCFLAATAYGGNLLVDAVIGATRALPADSSPRRSCAHPAGRSCVSWPTSPLSPASSTWTCRRPAPGP